MDKEEVIKNLRILGIVDVEQFQKGDLRYWWQIKFKEIKKYYGKESRDLLIKTNTAVGELEKLDMKLVRRCLSEKNAIPSPKPHASENINYYQRQKINRSRIALEKLKEN